MSKMETTGAFIGRKLNNIGSGVYRNIVFPFVKAGIERRNDCIIGKGTYLYKGCVLAGKDFIGDNVELCNVSVGYSVYIGAKAAISNTIIGNYSCVGSLETIAGRHPVKGECVSIHPAFYSGQKQFGYSYVSGGTFPSGEAFEEVRYVDSACKYNVSIGNDVWIGRDVLIVDGVTVGDGAVIGAGSLVTSDVEPYAIYAGTPAKRIGSRFDEATASKLLDIRWWDKGEDWIKAHADLFCDPERFLKEVL